MSSPSTEVGPGFLAFVVFFVLALALWLLMRNMFTRLRRMNLAERADEARRADGEPTGAGDEQAVGGREESPEASGGDRPEEGERGGREV